MTDAELKLWYHLRRRGLQGRRFRRQVPVGQYVVDFLCEEARLVVEVDGGQHAERTAEDAARSRWLSTKGYAVLRFWNHDVLANVEVVLETISEALPSPCPLPREGEREFAVMANRIVE